ncbi:MAG: helix-turn-helix domain-containing protein [Elusimicrobiota bacterium]|jgi:DNA-binding transcriptional MerR regulator|nr:helix-turn-helix domain-containing protein [Elusimicrobiota bacterium]
MSEDFAQQKEYYKIGEISQIAGVDAYTLRHWEKRGLLTPMRNETKVRVYRQQEIDLINEIKSLIKDGMTLSGIKKKLVAQKRKKKLMPELNLDIEVLPDTKILQEIKSDLLQLLKVLNDKF